MWLFIFTDKSFRPFNRRLFITPRPPRVDILFLKPWTLILRRIFGWYVRFGIAFLYYFYKIFLHTDGRLYHQVWYKVNDKTAENEGRFLAEIKPCSTRPPGPQFRAG